ncbi:hypothetical protein BDV97DRAFT_368272 [Delphinella strobiligena]|nr:hypothetical protein BDV97DRAFT_368272 [Delphinella strobiligena]
MLGHSHQSPSQLHWTMLLSHHLKNYVRPLDPSHARSSTRGASTPLRPACPAQTAHARERNPTAPLPNVRTTFCQASGPGPSPRNNTIISPTPYIPYQKDDQMRNAQHLTLPTNEHGTPEYHGIIDDTNRQGHETHVAGNASNTIVEEPRTTRLPASRNRYSNTADANPRSLARLEYSLNGAIRSYEDRTGGDWIHPQQHRSNTDLPGTADAPPTAPSQPRQTGFQVSTSGAKIWLWIPLLLSLFSTIFAICLFIEAKTKPWSTSAQTCLLVWMTVSIGILFTSLLTFCRLGQLGRGGCLAIDLGRGGRLLSIRPTRTRSDEQTAREEGLELSSFDGNNRHHTCEPSGRDGGGRRRDEHDGGAGPVLQPIRFSFEPRNISGTSRSQADTAPLSKSYRSIKLAAKYIIPKSCRYSYSIRTSATQTQPPWLQSASSTAKCKGRSQKSPSSAPPRPMYPDLITQEQLLQFRKEQDQVCEKYRQGQQHVRRKAWLNSKQRPDTPRVKPPTLIARTCSDISAIEEVQTPIVVQRTRGPPLRISDVASPGLGTSPTSVSPLAPSGQRVQADSIGGVVIPAAADADSPIAAIKDLQHEILIHEQMRAGNRHQEPSGTRTHEGRNKPVPPIPHENSHLPDYPSPPSSYGDSTFRYSPTQVSAEGSERSAGLPFSSEQEDDAVSDASTNQTHPALSESVMGLDRHIRNSGAVELNKFLTDEVEDKYPETQALSLDRELEKRCRGRNRERAWFNAHLSWYKNSSALEDPELDLEAEIGAARDDARYVPFSAVRTASVQSPSPLNGPAPEASIGSPLPPAPGQSYSSAQSLGEHFETLLQVPVVHAEQSQIHDPYPVLRRSRDHHHLPSLSPLDDQNDERAPVSLEPAKAVKNRSPPTFSGSTRAARRNAIAYSPASAPLFSHTFIRLLLRLFLDIAN